MNYQFVKHGQGTDEWKMWRRFKIGASEIAALMNASPFYPKTPLQLWENKVEGKEQIENPAMLRGRDLEPIALEWVNKELKTQYKPACIESLSHPYLISSLDGMDQKGPCLTLEIKNMKLEYHNEVKTGKIPENYKWQVQSQMLVSDSDSALFCSFQNDHGHILEIKKDAGMWDRILEESAKFNENLMNYDPPALTDRDYHIVENEKFLKMLVDYDLLENAHKKAEKHMKAIKDEITFALSKDGIKRAIIGSKKISNYPVKGRIDYDSIS